MSLALNFLIKTYKKFNNNIDKFLILVYTMYIRYKKKGVDIHDNNNSKMGK